MENECTQPGSWQGSCCCNCTWQKPLNQHPWNRIELFKGSIMNIIGWGCFIPDMDSITVSDREHGMCEMWENKKCTTKNLLTHVTA
jgi:hypothetical protein